MYLLRDTNLNQKKLLNGMFTKVPVTCDYASFTLP